MAAVYKEEEYVGEGKAAGGLTIPYQPPVQRPEASEAHSDYSNYTEHAKLYSTDSVRSVFRKGVFGAYVTGMEFIDN